MHMQTDTRERHPAPRDDSAWAAALESARPMMYAIIGRMMVDPDETEDVVQHTCAQVWAGRRGYRGAVALDGWLGRCARNAALNRLAQLRRREALQCSMDEGPEDRPPLDPPDPGACTARHALAAIELAEARASLRRLRPMYREVIAMHAAGYPYREAAELLGVSLDAYKSRLHQARVQMQQARRCPGAPPERQASV